MSAALAGFEVEQAIALKNADYPAYLGAVVREARSRIWAVNFFVNPCVAQDDHYEVRDLLTELGYAQWRGVDVRLLVTRSETPVIRIANETTVSFLRHLNVAARFYSGRGRTSTHSKYLVIDDNLIVLGSHNWSPDAFRLNDEDSVAATSGPLCTWLADEFSGLWTTSKA